MYNFDISHGFSQSHAFNINHLGNIGFGGMSSTTYKFTLYGNMDITGDIYKNGSLYFSGTSGSTTADIATTALSCSGNSSTATNAYTNTFTIKAPDESSTSILYLSTPYNASSAAKCSLIAQGLGHYSTSKLHICLNNTSDNNTTYTANDISRDSRMTIDKNGNVGIGNTNPINNGTTNHLCIGNSAIANSSGLLVIGRNNASGSQRHFATYFDETFLYVFR
jgi:hypothetical protein